jgi:hypothetical protein
MELSERYGVYYKKYLKTKHMKLYALAQLSQLSSKMDHQIDSSRPLTLKKKMDNFHSSSKHLSPKNKGRMLTKTFGK